MTTYFKDVRHERVLTLEVAGHAGQVAQMPDGRAGVIQGLNAAALAAGVPAAFVTTGVFRVAKTTGIAILDGGKVCWDNSASKAHFKTANDRDFFLGTAVGDAAEDDTTMLVNINVQPVYTIDVLRDPFYNTNVANGSLVRLGGCHALKFTTAAEAQKVDLLSKAGIDISSNPIVEFGVEVVTNGDDAATDFNVGLASGTHSTDADSIAKYLFLHMDGASLNLNVQSKDGTTTVASTDTTVDAVLATRFEVWLDCRNPADVAVYIDGVRVLEESTFRVDAATLLYLLAHSEKTSNDSPGEFHVDGPRVRTMLQ
ncbi:capsid cement protein [Planctomicrobium sp. SH661]|uniref:capsid cement protein n=1 Tax=Planctomicrobium sp. SH661 TaxID=3448124 RepID=UPI003F5C8FE1